MECDKVSYKTEKEAKHQIIGLSQRKKNSKFSTYKCNNCGQFHIFTTNKHTLQKKYKHNKYPLKLEDKKKRPLPPVNPKNQHPNTDWGIITTGKIMSSETANEIKKKLGLL